MKRSKINPSNSVEALAKILKRKKTVLVLGAGATVSLAQNPAYTLVGLRNDAKEYLKHTDGSAKIRSGADFTNLAGLLKKKNLFDAFLYDKFADLALHPSKLAYNFLEILLRFQMPILTTNYDDIIERETGFRSLTLANKKMVSHVFTEQQNNCVIHLHGVFHEPSSIVLSNDDYSRLVSNDTWEILHDNLADKHILFIGFNQSMYDPAFRLLRSKISKKHDKSIVADWSWLRPLREYSTPKKAVPEPKHFYFDNTNGGKESIQIHTDKLTAALAKVLHSKIERPLKKVPIAFPVSAKKAHRDALASAESIRMAAHKGTWLREVLIPHLKERRLAASRTKLWLSVALLEPSRRNFKFYSDFRARRGLSKEPFETFANDIWETVRALKRLNGSLCNVDLHFSSHFSFFRTTIANDEVLFVTVDSEEPILLLKNDNDGYASGSEDSDGISPPQSEDSAISPEAFFFAQFSRSVEFQFRQSRKVNLAVTRRR